MSMRHSRSAGGRFFPPPKYCSYSIFNWRMSFSIWFMSSSVVLAIVGRYILMLRVAARRVNAPRVSPCGIDNAHLFAFLLERYSTTLDGIARLRGLCSNTYRLRALLGARQIFDARRR